MATSGEGSSQQSHVKGLKNDYAGGQIGDDINELPEKLKLPPNQSSPSMVAPQMSRQKENALEWGFLLNKGKHNMFKKIGP